MVTKPTSKSKASKKAAPIGLKNHAPANVSVPDEDRIRERAYGIWIEEGRPHGHDLAHWQRARNELQQDAR
jgi:hypothetical protein